MINLADYLRREHLITPGPAARDVIVRALLDVCLRAAPELSEAVRTEIRDGAHRMAEQALGAGFAIAHARISEGDDIRLAVALLGEPRPFGRCGPVHTVFCALIPPTKSREYLSLLARLSRLLSAPGADAVFRSADPEAVARFVREFRT